MTMNSALVTGGGGFIGSAITLRLLDRGIRVTVLGRNRYPALERAGATCIRGDIRDRETVGRAAAGQDAVFHVAAKAGIWGPWQEYAAINVQGTVNVIRACRENRVGILVHTSTPSVVFDRHSLEGVDESAPYARRTLCHYATSKIIAEKLVLAANSPHLLTTALRPHLVWGPGDTNLIPRLLARGRAGRLKIVGNGTNLVDIAYIDNVADAHLLAADELATAGRAAGHPFFIAQAEPVNLWQWINTLFAGLDIPRVRARVPFAVAHGAGWLLEMLYGALGRTREPPMTRFVAHQLARSHWFSGARARQILGYRPLVSTQEGLARLQRWLKGEEPCPVPAAAGGSGQGGYRGDDA